MNRLASVDFFSQKPGLKINNNDRLTSPFSISLSLLALIAFANVFFYYMYCSFALVTYNILESQTDHKNTPINKIFENKISFTVVDETGKEFKDHERLFSIEARFKENNPLLQESNSTNIPVVNCNIYQNLPFKTEFENLSKFWPSSKCLDFKKLNRNLYGRYGSLTG